jgi:CubicO group peptidase (beta-lactamase class C family)
MMMFYIGEEVVKFFLIVLFLFGTQAKAKIESDVNWLASKASSGSKAAVGELKSLLSDEMIKDNAPGISFSLSTSREAIVSGSFWNLDHVNKTDFSRSKFRVASVSKVFTGFGTMSLINKGLINKNDYFLDVDTPFTRKVRSLLNEKQKQAFSRITISDLASHLSGLSKEVPGSEIWTQQSQISDGAYPSMQKFWDGIPFIENLFEPGVNPYGYKYSNLGVNILAMHLGSITYPMISPEKAFHKLMDDQLFKPLKMTNTGYEVKSSDLTPSFGSTFLKRPQLPFVTSPGSYSGSVGVATTALDMSRVGQELLRLLRDKGNRLPFTQDVLLDYWSPTANESSQSVWGNSINWSILGINQSMDDVLWAGHTGTGYGERALFLLSPDKDIAITVLFSGNDLNREKYAMKIVDKLLPHIQSLGLSNTSQLPNKTKKLLTDVKKSIKSSSDLTPPNWSPSSEVPEALKPFVGIYFSDVWGPFQIGVSNNDKLTVFGMELESVDTGKGLFKFPSYGLYYSREPAQFIFGNSGSIDSFIYGQSMSYKKIR